MDKKGANLTANLADDQGGGLDEKEDIHRKNKAGVQAEINDRDNHSDSAAGLVYYFGYRLAESPGRGNVL